jgi:DNA-binding MarR family transcriptional regulator
MVDDFYKTEGYESRRSITYLVRRASHLATSAVEEVFTDSDLTFIQWVILMNLRDNLTHNCAGLCQNIRYDSGALTRVIDQLEQRRLLERRRSQTDRREIELHLTPLGLSTTESLLPKVVRLYNSWLPDFTQDEADTLVKLLTKFISQIIPPTPADD